jgi:NADPH-dependent FMN reductase
MAKIALIVGSVRQDRQGIRVARWLEQKLQTRDHIVHFIDPLESNLPLLDRMYKEMKDPSEELIHYFAKVSTIIDQGRYLYGLEYENGDIENGPFEVCVYLVNDAIESCGNGYNGEEKNQNMHLSHC